MPDRRYRQQPFEPHSRGVSRLTGTVLASVVAGGLAVAAVAVTVLSEPDAEAAPGITVEGSDFVDVDGEPLVLRGINYGHTWFPDHAEAFAEIAALGANAIRVVLSAGTDTERDDADDVAEVLDLCWENQLVCVLEVHDTAGWGDSHGAAHLSMAVDYWIDLRETLAGTEDYVIVNVANEPFGRSAVDSWLPDSSQAISRLRDAGIRHALVVDGPDWGQDSSQTMASNAEQLLSADPDGNTMLSVHMYEVYGYEGAVDTYLDQYRDRGLPIMVGEFGWTHMADMSGVRAEDVLARSDVSWLAWSWWGSGDPVEYLDLVTSGCDSTTLSDWGQDVRDGLSSARRASVFAGSGGDLRAGPSPCPAPTTAPEPASGPAPEPAPEPAPGPAPGPAPESSPESSPGPSPESSPVADPVEVPVLEAREEASAHPTEDSASRSDVHQDGELAAAQHPQELPAGGDGAAPDDTGEVTAYANAVDTEEDRSQPSGPPSDPAMQQQSSPASRTEPDPASAVASSDSLLRSWPASLFFSPTPTAPGLLPLETATPQTLLAVPPADAEVRVPAADPSPSPTPSPPDGLTPPPALPPASALPSPDVTPGAADSDTGSDVAAAPSSGDDSAPGRTGTAPTGHPYCEQGYASDSDRDGWGWENEQSCVVPGSLADYRPEDAPPPPMAPTGRPYCMHGTLTDPDGDGWGYEHVESCIVPGGPADQHM